jgi:hypothetical protein
MSNLFRLFIVGCLCACAVLLIAVGMARNAGALLAPVQLLLFLLAAALYLSPVFIALHRGCEATLLITLVDVFLGWTILGWFAAFGWAVAGKTRPLPPAAAPPPVHPLPSH